MEHVELLSDKALFMVYIQQTLTADCYEGLLRLVDFLVTTFNEPTFDLTYILQRLQKFKV